MTNNQLVAAFAAFLAQQGQAKPSKKAAKVGKYAAKQHKQANGKAAVLAAKDKATLAGFAKLGIQDVVLMDRDDLTKPFNCKTFDAWISLGQVVQKGQHGVNGLFHVSQTKPLAKAA